MYVAWGPKQIFSMWHLAISFGPHQQCSCWKNKFQFIYLSILIMYHFDNWEVRDILHRTLVVECKFPTFLNCGECIYESRVLYITLAYTLVVQDNSLRLTHYMLCHFLGHPGIIYLDSIRI